MNTDVYACKMPLSRDSDDIIAGRYTCGYMFEQETQREHFLIFLNGAEQTIRHENIVHLLSHAPAEPPYPIVWLVRHDTTMDFIAFRRMTPLERQLFDPDIDTWRQVLLEEAPNSKILNDPDDPELREKLRGRTGNSN